MRRVLVLAITMVSAVAAHAHVAPSVDDNGRYLKLTPLGDRVRLAYTVFFGEVPGREVRTTIDRDGDGTISEAEATSYAGRLAAEVADGLDVEIDGAQQKVVWSDIAVGMTNRTVARGGSFSVDMVAYLCLSPPRGKHRLALRDRFRIPKAGETELKVDDGPGITIDRARIGGYDDPAHDFKFAGPGGPLTDSGLELAFSARPDVPIAGDGVCTGKRSAAGAAAPTEAKGGIPTILVVGMAAIAGMMLAAVVTFLVRRRRAG